MRADLHNHLLIGFQDYWQRLQGYEGKNLAEVMFKAAARRDIDLVAITSQENMDVIPKNSVHDRINYLKNEAYKLNSRDYSHDSLGPNSLIIERRQDNKRVIIISGQTARPIVNGKHYDHLVIGSNQVPNNQPLEDTLKFCSDKGLIQIAEHPYVMEHGGLGKELLKKYLEQYEAIEGHNAQMIWPEFLSSIPKIGKYNQGVNKKAQEFSQFHNKPWIATSDAHHPKETGLGYIDFEHKKVNTENEEKIISSLRVTVGLQDFENFKVTDHLEIFRWLKWTAQFNYGIKKFEGETSTR